MTETDYSLPILLYHRVITKRSDAGRSSIFVYKDQLKRQFDYLKNKEYKTLTFKDLANIDLTTEKINHKSVILTFDDGYMDNYEILFPMLKAYGFTAVIFLVTRHSRNEWGIREGEPAINLMGKDQIEEMIKYGIEFGSHTQTHPVLQNLSVEARKPEIFESKSDVENITRQPVISFAYPFGGFDEAVKAEVKNAGYAYGIATRTGPDFWKEDLMQIKRIEVTPRTTLFSFKRKASGYYYTKSLLRYLLNI